MLRQVPVTIAGQVIRYEMTIQIIHTKSTLRPKIILFSVITALILLTIILLSPDLMMVINYKILDLILIITLLSQFVFTLYFIFSKKYEELGKILVQESDLSVKIGREIIVYHIKDMKNPRVFINQYNNKKRIGLFGHNKFETGNFLLFQYNEKTRLYELLLKNKRQTDKFITHLKNYIPDKNLEVFMD
ncbi:MAG: hypothetical protein PVF73_00450 [Bacteroidales bacterium]|jgi:hypothetical protein